MLQNEEAAKVERDRAFAMGGIIKDPSVPGQLVYVTPLKKYVCHFENTPRPLHVLLQRREHSQRFSKFSAALFECQVPTCKAPVREQLCMVEAESGTPLRRWTYCMPCGGIFRAEVEMFGFVEQSYGEEQT